MARRFEGAPPPEAEPSGGSEDGEGREDDSSPASRVRARYERRERERQRVAENESPERRKEQVGGAGRGGGLHAWAHAGRRWLALAALDCDWLTCLPRCRRLLPGAGARHVCGGGQDQLPGRHLRGLRALPAVSSSMGGSTRLGVWHGAPQIAAPSGSSLHALPPATGAHPTTTRLPFLPTFSNLQPTAISQPPPFNNHPMSAACTWSRWNAS